MLTDGPTMVAEDFLQRFFSTASQERLKSLSELKTCDAKEFLFHEGQTHPWLYLVLAGRVDLLMTIPGRGPTRILTLGPGELVGWSAAVGESVMTCDGICSSEVRVLKMSRSDLEELCTEDPRFGYEFMRMLAASVAKRLTATRLQLLDLFQIK